MRLNMQLRDRGLGPIDSREHWKNRRLLLLLPLPPLFLSPLLLPLNQWHPDLLELFLFALMRLLSRFHMGNCPKI